MKAREGRLEFGRRRRRRRRRRLVARAVERQIVELVQDDVLLVDRLRQDLSVRLSCLTCNFEKISKNFRALRLLRPLGSLWLHIFISWCHDVDSIGFLASWLMSLLTNLLLP